MKARLLLAAASLLAALALAPSVSAGINPQSAGLQVALRAWGVYLGPVDGIAGPQTARGVRAFQRRAGLPVTGIAARSTRRALGRLGHPLYGRRQMHRGMVGWDVSVLQFMLSRRGSPTGIVDGYFGPETQRALRRFQRRHGLTADAVVGPMTRQALGGGPAAGVISKPRGVKAKINYWSGQYGMSARFVRALAWIESGFQPHVVSSVGARGVMQVTPATRHYVQTMLLGRPVPRTVDGNIEIGVVYLRHLYRSFHGNRRLALAAYNQGPSSVRRNGVYRETRRFVANVLASVGRV